MSNKKDRGDLFVQGLLTFVLTMVFLIVATGIVALVVWVAVEFGAVVIPIAMLVGVVIALAWGAAGWLLK
jgi:high-affinity K+ transport system ATPase subunit B